jgi:hypothetical protein
MVRVIECNCPNGIKGATKPGPDFLVTTFTKADGSVLLGAYSGLHPDFNDRGSRNEKDERPKRKSDYSGRIPKIRNAPKSS